MAARIAERSKRAIVDRVDMAAVVGETVRLRKAGNSLTGLCPFHEEKTPSFTVNPHQKVFYCHGCGAGGDVIKFVRELLGFSYVEALEHLAQRAGVAIEWQQTDPRQREREQAANTQRRRLLDLNNAAQEFFVRQLHSPIGIRARTYLEERGLGRETVERFGIGCAADAWGNLSDHLLRNGFSEEELLHVGLAAPRKSGRGLYDRFRDRVMFPVFTRAGDMVAFGGRTLSDDKKAAKYMNSPESELDTVNAEFNRGLTRFYKKSHCVFGLRQAMRGIRGEKMALIVEGNLDVMILHQAGMTNAVCGMGTALTSQQLGEIRRFTDRVALIFDGDKAGRAAARKAVPLCIEAGMGGVYVNLPQGEDPDSLVRTQGVEALRTLIEEAPSLIMGYIDAAVAASDGTILGKRKVIELVQQVLARIHHPIERDLARSYLAGKLDVPRDDLERYLRRVKVERKRPEPEAAVTDTVAAEPPIDRLEMELVRALCQVPSRITWVVDQGCMDDVRHEGLAQTLIRIADRDRERAKVDTQLCSLHNLQTWLHELPDSRSRRAMMRALVELEPMDLTAAQRRLTFVLDHLEIRTLRGHEERIRREMGALGTSPDSEQQGARLWESYSEIRARLQELEKTTSAATTAHVAGRTHEESRHV